MKRVALAIGMACWVLGIQLLLLSSKVILRLYLKNNNVLISPLSRQSRFFLPKLLLLARSWDRKMADPSVSPSGLFILARDQAFLKTLFFSADRESDLGCV